MKQLSEKKANAIYDILTSKAGANEAMRDTFIYHHCKSRYGCDEFRFGGKLGFGGKYYSHTNTVSCYTEDETETVLLLIESINDDLRLID
jgi:hypothetical protein